MRLNILLIILCASFIACSSSDSLKNVNIENAKKVTIIKNGGEEKILIEEVQITEILTFINSIDFEEKVNEDINGWLYTMDIMTTDDKVVRITLASSYMYYQNDLYKIEETSYPELDILFK